MLIENIDYFVRVVRFPNAANKGAVFLNPDGTYDVYLNSRYTDLTEGYDHEVRHLLLGHFHDDSKSIGEIEAEAAGEKPVTRSIPMYSDLRAMCARMWTEHGEVLSRFA